MLGLSYIRSHSCLPNAMNPVCSLGPVEFWKEPYWTPSCMYFGSCAANNLFAPMRSLIPNYYMFSSFLCLLGTSLALISVTCATGPQVVLESPTALVNTVHTYNSSQVQSLHLFSIGSEGFTALSHPKFPNHRVRVKKSNFCDPTVK